ncbi:PREDICTED: hemicentin-1-like [Amphimedon queenslandica]|uniref:Ig-like domain-containing protein n=1 Tax=Amphimedon queenslandica TaxID=400682 RepID=A0AAN0IH99_AMPQE|nr:PREDICTED: hemicentin-1-like [Amphimedon queenslandica]|eukprot:XP_003389282.1 PREDICTED: hemicentin-1-like [Amphimedon queenslandica]
MGFLFQRATVSGNYTCVTTSTCGSVTNTTFIKEAPTVAPGTGISINPGNTPVPAGTRTCISSGVGSLVRLVCNLAFNNESVSDVTFSWSTPGGGNQSGSTITARSPGDYTCTASNPCGSSQATTEVVGRIQQTKGTVTGIDQTIDIGSRLCINSANSVRINCNTDFGTSVTRIWRRDGNVISGVTGSSYDAVPSDVGSAITCAVMNPCGMDSAVTQVITQAPVTINGTISTLNISDNGCDRPGITSTGVDLCPLDGERVEISCSSNEGYTITGPGGSSMDASLVIMNFNLSDSGTYTCRSTSTVCGGAVSTIVVSGSGVPPSISTDTPATATPTLPPTVMNRTIPIGTDICLLETQFVTIDCRTQSGTEPIRFTWTAASTGSRVIANGMRITVNNTDVYTCNATNAFGTSTASSTVERRLSVSLNGVSPQGSRCDQLKRRPPGVDYCAFVGDSVTLSCSINSPTVPTTIYLGSTSSTSDIPFIPILPSAEGNYLCNATNDCGTSSDMLNLRVYDPARIDRQQTLPPPGPNEEVIGAGRPDEPNEVTPGRTVRLFCPFTGIDPANTTWLRVRPDGFTTEIDTSLPAFSINNTGNVSVLIISPFTREFEGTYRCTTTNIAGDDAGDVVLQATVEVIPEWVTSPWSECQPKCHRGMRMRLVHCVDRLSGRRLPDNRCTESKPLTMESCVNSGPCFTTPKWKTGNWTGCSVSCGGGHRTRSVTCVIPLTGETVPDSRCIDVRKPRDHEYCNDHSCCVSDAYKACKHIAGTHSCSFGYMRTICCWTCRHYHYY